MHVFVEPRRAYWNEPEDSIVFRVIVFPDGWGQLTAGAGTIDQFSMAVD
jgi:hypothetical protein